MLVTAYTDASFHNGKASWAVYLKCDEGTVKKARLCPEEVKNIQYAELYAVAKALQIAVNHWGDKPKVLFVNSDSMNVINAFAPDSNHKFKAEYADLLNRIKGYLAEKNITIRTKHVPAHSGGKDIRSWLNKWCDKEAKKARKNAH